MQGREDPPVRPEIGVTHVRTLDCAMHAEREAAEVVGAHGLPFGQDSRTSVSTREPLLAPFVIGMGCMRLSTERDRDEARAIAVLDAAFDAGIFFLDTADAYCWDANEVGHNERLIARALAAWSGDRSRILVATKGGLIRPHGGWVEDGRAGHLVAACEASRRALGVERIHLYQLHAPDPRTPLSTSVRALDSLKRDGHVEAIGLCNVNVGQIEEARSITEIAAVQVELGIWHDGSVLSGVAEYCLANMLGLSWAPEIAEETLTSAQVDAGFAQMQELLGVSIEIEYCPHGGGPPICWCRKPLPGLGVVFIHRHRLDASQCIYVGAGAQDPGFARRLGFQYRESADFFAPRN